MGKLEKEFKEFLILNEDRISSESRKFKDIYIGGNHLLRQYEDKSKIYYLTSPDSITIPNLYIDIFTHFNVSYSGKISEYRDYEKLDTIDKIIYDSIYLSIDIQSNLLYYKTNDILGRIEEIVNLGGTKEIRELVEKVIGLSIEPWIIENLNGSIEI
jgi:hypothetical protein